MKKALLFFALLFSLQVHASTVIGIHGFINDWRTMKPIEHCLKHCGHEVCLWGYESRRGCIKDHAANLVLACQRIACAHPGEPIHFVSHSIGGIILRAALNHPECPMEAKIGRAVLLAPPNQGSILARQFRGVAPIEFFMGNKSGWELRTYGPCEMACFGEFPCTMDVLVIAGTKGNQIWFNKTNDGFLTLEETYLNTPYYFQSYYVAHGDMMRNKCVLCCMKTFINNWRCVPSP